MRSGPALLAAALVGCGGSDDVVFGADQPDGGGTGGATAGSGGAGAAGDAGAAGVGGAAGAAGAAATGGASGSAGSAGGAGSPAGGTGGSGGSAGTGGSAGAAGGTGGTSGTGGGAGTAGSAGAPTCPGTAPGCVIDWAGQFNAPGDVDDVGTLARFDALGEITGDATSLYVAAHNAVRRIDIATATVTTLAGGSGIPGYLNATGTAARFDYVAGVATDGTTVWVVDSGNVVIRAVDIATGAVTTLAGDPGNPGNNDGVGAGARFEVPRGIAFDGTALYVIEVDPNNALRRVEPTTGAVTTLAGMNGAGTQNGAGTSAQFNRPRSLEALAGGSPLSATLFVGDTENHQVRSVTTQGAAATTTVSLLAGGANGTSPGCVDAVGPAARLNRLRGLAHDGQDLIVADSDSFVLRKVALPSGTVTTIAGTCNNQGHAVGIGPGAAFDKPMDVHFDPGSGDLFIVESTVIRRMFYR